MNKLYLKGPPQFIAILIVFLFFFYPNLVFSQTHQQIVDSLLQKLPSVKKGSTTRIDLLNEIAYVNRRISGKATMQYARLALKEALAANYAKGSAIANKNLGIAHFKMSSPIDSMVYYYNTAIRYAEKINDYYTQAACYNNIALVYSYKKNPDEVLQHYLKGIEIFDTHIKEEKSLKALMLANVAQFHYALDKPQKALEYIKRAFDIAQQNQYKFIKTNYSDDYGSILIKLKRYEAAEKILHEGLALSKASGDETSLVWNLNFLSALAIIRNQCAQAKTFQKTVPAPTEGKELKSHYINHQLICAKIAFCEQDYKQATEYAKQAYSSSQKIESLALQQKALQLIEKIMSAKGDYRQAYDYSSKFHSLNDSIAAVNKIKFTEELEAKFQSEEKQKEIAFLEKTQAISDSYIQQLWFFVGLAMLGICYIFFLLYKKRENQRVINAKNKELKKYIASNLQLENFAYIASHDLRAPLLTMQNFTNLVKKTAKERLNKEEMQSLYFISSASGDMINLVDNLMDFSSLQKSSIKKEKIYLKDFINYILDLNKTLIHKEEATIELKLETPFIYGDRSKLLQLFQNLILNAIKFHKPGEKPKVLIQCFANIDNCMVSVKDEGIGIDSTYFDKIFLLFKQLHNKINYGGTGIGLAVCKQIVDMHSGKIWVESKLGEGTTFSFALPR